jgi:hypothetical protein
MRKKTSWVSVVAFLLLINGYIPEAFGSGADTQIGPGPVAFFPETLYDAGMTLEGVDIKHDFIIQNRGTTDLLIQNVKTS